MRAQVVACFLLICSPAGSAGAQETPAPTKADEKAKAGEKSLVLLPIEGQSSFPALDSELAKAAEASGRAVQQSNLKLDDLMLAVGCNDRSVACLQKIGQNMSVDGLILGHVKLDGDKPWLDLRWFDVQTGGDRGRSRHELPKDERQRLLALRAAVQDLFNLRKPALADVGGRGGLSISSSTPLVEVLIDGQPRGALPLELRDLMAGTYAVVARREGYTTWRGEVTVRPSQMTRLEVELQALPRAMRTRGYLEAIRLRTWILAGIGVTCLVTGSAFGAVMRSQQNELDGMAGVTLSEIERMKELTDSGERNALTANVLYGLGAGTMIAALVVSYLDYRQGRFSPDEKREAKVRWGVGSAHLVVSF